MYNPSPPASLNLSGTERAQGEQYAGERATCDNASIIVKGVFPSTGSLRRAYRPAYGGACGRYAVGEGMTPCWAAAARQGGTRGAGRREHARVARSAEGGFPGVLPLAGRGKYTLTCVNPNPAFAGFPAKRVEAKRYARRPKGCMPPGGRPLCGRKVASATFWLSRGLPYRVTAELGVNVETIEGTSSGECRYKARPCGPTNRAAAAAGRRDRRARRWGGRPPVLTAHSRRKAGLAAAHGRYLVV